MNERIRQFLQLVRGSFGVVLQGGPAYRSWVTILVAVIAAGTWAYSRQLSDGLIVTNMRDQVSWGFYIGNFTFLVGVAAAAVILVVPAYVYHWKPVKEVVLLGELMAVAAIVMCILFVTVDVGRPAMVWHMLPIVGTPNFPFSMLSWDVLVLTAYMFVNLFVVVYLTFKAYQGQAYRPSIVLPIVFLSIPMAIAIHTVTAFLFVSLVSRPFWNVAILAPRFITSAFCSGPALMVLIFMLLRRLGLFRISTEALTKVGELMAYTMAFNLFLLGAEVFKEFYYLTQHSVHATFQWFGIHGHGMHAHGGVNTSGIAVFAWTALAANVVAFAIFIVPVLRHRMRVLAVGCALAICGVYIEKGLGLLLPGMTPDALGEVYNYSPSRQEILVASAVWAIGALIFTLMAKVTMAIQDGVLRAPTRPGRPAPTAR